MEKLCSRLLSAESVLDVLLVEVEELVSVVEAVVPADAVSVELLLLSNALTRLRKLCSRFCRAASAVEVSVEPVLAVDDESDELSSLACAGGGGGGGGREMDAASLVAVELEAVAGLLLELAVPSELVELALVFALLF